MYTENDTKSDKRIEDNNSQYKTHQQYKNTFPQIQHNRTISNISTYIFQTINKRFMRILMTLFILYILYTFRQRKSSFFYLVIIILQYPSFIADHSSSHPVGPRQSGQGAAFRDGLIRDKTSRDGSICDGTISNGTT